MGKEKAPFGASSLIKVWYSPHARLAHVFWYSLSIMAATVPAISTFAAGGGTGTHNYGT